jgi:hypothetical protein
MEIIDSTDPAVYAHLLHGFANEHRVNLPQQQDFFHGMSADFVHYGGIEWSPILPESLR